MVRPSCDDSRPVAEVKPDTWSGTRKTKDDTVTLTQSQFQQILQAIGQANNNNSNVGANHENRDLSPLKYVPESNGHAPEPSQDVPNTLSNAPDVARRAEEGGCEKPPIACPLDVVISCPAAALSWSSGELSPLSKVEQKRLQWEKEKAEMIDWNPWGKPGAGAPAKKTQVVAPITPRHNNQQLLMVHTSTAVPYQQSMASPSRFLPEPSPGQCHSFLPNKTFSQYNCVAQPIKPVPPVFKSSIAFGNGDNESVASDYFKRQQWLQELGYQREEQRKAQEQMSDPMWMNGCKDDSESISVSVDGSVMPGVARNYMRGQGFQLDPVSAALAEERRQKAQEYQRAIREQMEEKQRRLEAERERKKLEEEAEERRLESERARIHAEYEQEQMRIKQKAEMEERKHQVLVSAVQQAQAQAEMEKKTRKIQKMLPPPPPESVLASPKRTQEKQDLPSLVEDKLKIEDKTEEPPDSPSSHRREPSRASETESCFSEQKEFGVQTSEDRKSSFVVDRVLTPSIFRVRAKTGRGKDCGTQTEAQFGKYAAEDAESTESNTSSFHSPRRIVRVQHSKPCKVQRRIVEMPEERPKWGVNQPSKSYVRMTERDPHFSKRKRMQELRRQHWARELAAQKTGGQLSTRRSNVTTSYPSLRGRRGASSSDCTLGYSSSEFETRSCRPFRSNSTPRYRQPSGFRSDHGSAETVAYMEAVPTVAHPMLRRRESQSSDNLPSIVGGSEPSPSRRIEGYGHPSYSLPPMRRKWHSQETFHPGIFHTYSPPHLLHRPLMEPFRPGPRPIIQRRKWSDQESFDLESVVRSRVEEGSRASSAESSEKSEKSSAASSAGSSARKSPANQNPLVCPEVVTGRPTPRQDRILQNLSSLRQGLLKKQKELESLIRRPPPYFS